MKTRIAALAGVVFTAALVSAEPPMITQQVTPGMVSYQGRLQESDGTVYPDGLYGVEFRLYNADTGGDVLWGTKYKPYLNNGYFTVILGQTGVGEEALGNVEYGTDELWKAVWIDPNLGQRDRFLGITVVTDKDEQEITDAAESFPRQRLLASPFAIQAQFAQQAQEAVLAEKAQASEGDFTVNGNLTTTAGSRMIHEGYFGQKVGGDYDVWIQGNTNSFSAGEARNLAMLGNTTEELLYVNYNSEYQNGTRIGGPVCFDDGGSHHYPLTTMRQGGFKVVVGTVNRDGSEKVNPANAFDSTQNANGSYAVTFDAPFTATPVVIVSTSAQSAAGGGDWNNFVSATAVTASGFSVWGLSNAVTKEDTTFSFIALGY